jgi:hypothetical protein
LATPLQTLFIPEQISGLRLSRLPLSATLFAVLKKLRVGTFGDLSGMTIRDFQRVSNKGTTLFVELTNLTQRARAGEFAATLGQNGRQLNSIGLRPFRANTPAETVTKKDIVVSSTHLSVTPLQVPTDERIFIPQEARGREISTFQVSVRLRHIFEHKRFCILGDIHGISYAEFGKFRNCGKKTVTELRELVRMVQRAQLIDQTDSVSEPFVALVGDWHREPENLMNRR